MPSITPIGTDIAVNTVTADFQTTPVTAALADGRYIVVWVGSILNGPLNNTNYANADIRAQVYNEDGSRSGGEFVVNAAPTTGVQVAPAVTLLSDGNFLIAWQDGIGSLSNPATTPAATIQAREFTLDADGLAQPVGAGIQIGAGSEAFLPAVTAVAGGGFVAAWQQGRSGNVVAQVYDSTNATVGSQITIDSTNLATIAAPRLVTLLDGNFVIGWANNPGTAPSPFSVQLYGANGAAVSPELPQYAGIPSAQLGNIIGLASGGFAVSSQYNLGTTASLVNFDLFFPDGTFGTTTQIAQNPVNAFANVRLAPLLNGGLVAAWVDSNATGSQPDIRIQAFNPIGDPVGIQYIVNTTTTGAQFQPVISALSTGDLVVAWRDDSSGDGEIRSRLIDFDSTNTPPVAGNAELFIPQLQPGDVLFDESTIINQATDGDGDVLTLTSITNVVNGTVMIEAGGTIRAQSAVGATDAIAFDYTVSDGNGGSATGRIRLVAPTDFITLRGSNAVVLDVLANDFLQPRPEGYLLTESSDFLQVATIGGRQQLLVNPFGFGLSYYDLLVNQSQTIPVSYQVINPTNGATNVVADVRITLQGWAQIGGTGTDFLVGGALPDSLQGGNGAANELIGGGGDDTYTSRAFGDTIVELAGGGTDTVRTDLPVFVLSANVENLFQIGNPSIFVGVGNAENNIIQGTSASSGSVLAGLGGNDTLTMTSFGTAELIGGTGDDVYVFSNVGTSVIEFAGGGIDTVRINNNYTLGEHVENLTYTGTARWSGAGNALDNVITGGAAAASELVGLGGNDTYVVRNIGDTIVEDAFEGTDTVQTSLSVYRLNAAHVENLTYTGTGRFTGIGNSLDNIITGGAGEDFLFAGQGDDVLTGRGGADIFFFDSPIAGIDRITDFISGSDRIFFNRSIYGPGTNAAVVSGAGPQAATTANATFLYNTTTGTVSYDIDGTGATAAIDLFRLDGGPALTVNDLVFYG